MGRDKHRSRHHSDSEEEEEERSSSRKHKSHRSRSRSPFKKPSSKWESPDRKRRYESGRSHYRDDRDGRGDGGGGSSGYSRDHHQQQNRYDRDRERNRDRKMRHRYDDDDGNYEWGKRDEKSSRKSEGQPPQDREKPNFGLSGKLTEDTNKVNGVVIKYAEPPEARLPKRRWRLYPFKGEKALPTLYIHRQSCYLIGRDRKICDMPVDHPSCSKQHAALQYRLIPFEREDGTAGKRVLPYIIDLDSANGTFLNNTKIEPRKYYQVMEKDVLKFGFSTREYVLLHENCKDETDEVDDLSLDPEIKEEIKEEFKQELKREWKEEN